MIEMNKKPKIGFYGITGCAGCLLEVVFQEDNVLKLFDYLDISAFPLIKEKNIEDSFDVIFVEGTVVDNEDLEKIKKLREKTKILIALGSCAANGGVPSMKNFKDKDSVEKFVYKELLFHKSAHLQNVNPSPLDAHVKVDFYIPQCPPNKKEVLTFILDFILGKTPRLPDKAVCYECTMQNNKCLLLDGKECLGPITAAGCEALCPSNGITCYGCRGPLGDANIEQYISIAKDQGCDEQETRLRFETFAGLKFKEIEDKNKAKK
jgi:sulfhydrogenase subunit delta